MSRYLRTEKSSDAKWDIRAKVEGIYATYPLKIVKYFSNDMKLKEKNADQTPSSLG